MKVIFHWPICDKYDLCPWSKIEFERKTQAQMKALNRVLFAIVFTCAFGRVNADPVVKFGTIEETWEAIISPDGENLAVGCSPKGVRGICIYDMAHKSSPKLIAPVDGARITNIFWASAEYLVYSIDTFVNVRRNGGPKKRRIDRLVSYRLEDGNSVVLMNDFDGLVNATSIESLLIDDIDKLLMSVTYYDGYGETTGSHINTKGRLTFVPSIVDLRTGKTKPYNPSARSISGAVYDQNGEKLIEIERQYESKRFALQVTQPHRRIIFSREDVDLAPFLIEGLSNDQSKVIVDFDDGERDGLYEIAFSDGAITAYHVNGEVAGDVGLIKDRYDATVVGYYATDDSTLATYTDSELASTQAAIVGALGIANVWLTSWTIDRSTFTAAARPPGRPTQYFLFDAKALNLSSIGGAAPWLNSAELGKVQKITYTASDGLSIPAYLTLPASKTGADGPYPLILLPHGGPESRDTADYDWLAQAFASEGYVVLQPNFRGSSGYGASFRDKGFGEFGGRMVSDVLDGAAYLIGQGIAKPDGYCAVGASYGGYSSLMIGIKEPASTKCVISINGVSEPYALIGEYPSGTPGVAYWEQYLGDRSKTDRRDRKSISPISRADELVMPVLLLHGEEDATVRFEQSRKLDRAAGETVELVKLPGADHYLGNSQTRQAILRESLAFLRLYHPVE